MTDTSWPNQDQRDKLNPSQPAPDPNLTNPSSKNPNKVDHAQLGEQGKLEGGKDMGLVHAPIVSMHPTSGEQSKEEEPKFKMIDNANFKLNHYLHEAGHVKFKYPFEDMDINQGMFIPVPANNTTDKLVRDLYKQINQFRKQNSEVERDENGDDIMEDVAINVKKRNEDGTIQLDGDTPRMDIKSGFRPKLIGPNFAVKVVVKGDKLVSEEDGEEADTDGVLIVRMS